MSGTQSPIYLDETQSRTEDTQIKTSLLEKESHDVGSMRSKKSWAYGDLGMDEKFTRITENEEIYLKVIIRNFLGFY